MYFLFTFRFYFFRKLSHPIQPRTVGISSVMLSNGGNSYTQRINHICLTSLLMRASWVREEVFTECQRMMVSVKCEIWQGSLGCLQSSWGYLHLINSRRFQMAREISLNPVQVHCGWLCSYSSPRCHLSECYLCTIVCLRLRQVHGNFWADTIKYEMLTISALM